MSPISRRAVLGLSLIHAGCSAGAGLADDGRSLRYWDLFTGGDGATMRAMLDAFRAEHPEIDLEAVTLQWGPTYYTKLAMAGAGGRAPDVAVLHLARLPGYAPAGLLDPFDPDLLAEFDLTEENFPAAVWQRAQYNGQVYAIPLDTHPYVMYYNVDVCREAGLLDADDQLIPLRGPDAVLAAFTAAKQVTGAYGLVTETYGTDGVNPWRMWWTLYRQLGGELLTPDGRDLAIDDAKALRALTFMQQLTSSGAAIREADGSGSIALFSSGQAGFMWQGDWEVTTLLASGVPFSMTRFPAVFDNASAQADGHSLVLPHRRTRSPAQARATYQLIAFLLRHSVTWAEGGHVPAYQPVARSAEYRALRPQSLYASVVEELALDPPVWFAGSASTLWLEMGAALSPVLTGRATPAEGLAAAKAAVRRLLATPNPVQ